MKSENPSLKSQYSKFNTKLTSSVVPAESPLSDVRFRSPVPFLALDAAAAA